MKTSKNLFLFVEFSLCLFFWFLYVCSFQILFVFCLFKIVFVIVVCLSPFIRAYFFSQKNFFEWFFMIIQAMCGFVSGCL